MKAMNRPDPVGVTARVLDREGGARRLSLAEAAASDLPTWIHVDFSHEEAKTWLWEQSGLDSVVVGAMLDTGSRPRSLQHGAGILTIMRGVNLNPGADTEDMISVRAWLEAGRVVTACRRELRSLDDISRELGEGDGPRSPQQFVLELIDHLNQYIGETADDIEDRIDQAEDRVSLATDVRQTAEFIRLRRQTAQIRRFLAPQREALDRISRVTDSLFSPAETVDLHEQLNQLTLIIEDLDLIRERTMVAQEEFLGVLAHEQNSRMLLLSIVAAIFLPLTFVTGLMGMNVAGLPGTRFPWSFWILVLIMLVVAGAILLLFHRRRWL